MCMPRGRGRPYRTVAMSLAREDYTRAPRQSHATSTIRVVTLNEGSAAFIHVCSCAISWLVLSTYPRGRELLVVGVGVEEGRPGLR